MKRSLRTAVCSSPKKQQLTTTTTTTPTTTTKKVKKTSNPTKDDDSFEFCTTEWERMWTIQNGFIRSIPYTFTFLTWAKQRWLGRSIGEVLVKEFHDRPASYYLGALREGLIRINDEPLTGEMAFQRLIEEGDYIKHTIHRHEPPLLNWERQQNSSSSASSFPRITIIYHKDGFMAVNKPPGLPVHPTGRYRRNTLVSLLQKQEFPIKTTEKTPSQQQQQQPQKLSPINRLDRLTSGVCMLATNSLVAKEMHQKMEGGQYFKKEYIARVKGCFRVDNPDSDGFIKVSIPLSITEHKLGLVVDDPIDGKESITMFKAIGEAVDGESLVLCRPLTGRTHQIRVHLRCLGYPITNDPLYGDVDLWKSYSCSSDEVDKKNLIKGISSTLLSKLKEKDGESSFAKSSNSTLETSNDPIIDFCPECNNINGGGGSSSGSDAPLPPKEEMCIYLHAFKYSSPEHCFEAKPFPVWVDPFNITDI